MNFESFWSDFEQEIKEESPEEPAERLPFSVQELEYETPQYQLHDGLAYLKLVSDMLSIYYHVAHGEPLIEDIFTTNDAEPQELQNTKKPRLEFHLDASKDKSQT